MKIVNEKIIKRLNIDYEFQEKENLLQALDQLEVSYKIIRSGPKLIDVGKCHPTLHQIIVEIEL